MNQLMYLLTALLITTTSFSEVTPSIDIEPLQSIGLINVESGDGEWEMEVNYTVVDHVLEVECFIDRMNLTKDHEGDPHVEGEGHLRVYLNEEHVGTLFQKAFVMRGLPSGTHELKVELVKNDRSPYGVEANHTVTIP